MQPPSNTQPRVFSDLADWTIKTLCVPVTAIEDYSKIEKALTDFLQNSILPEGPHCELINRITLLKEMLDEELKNSEKEENYTKFKNLIISHIAKKIRDIQNLSQRQKQLQLQYSPPYYFADDNECYTVFRSIVGYLHYPDTTKNFTEDRVKEYLSTDYGWISALVTETMMERHLYRINGNDSAWREMHGMASFPVMLSYIRIHEIAKLLFLKYQFGDDVHEPTLHYEEAHKKAIAIENFHLMMQAKNLGMELSLKSLNFLRVIDKVKLNVVPIVEFYSSHRFEVEKLKFITSPVPGIDVMKNNVKFMKAIKLWEYFECNEKFNLPLNCIENFVWRNWFLAHFSTLYPVGDTEGFAYILMRMEMENFFIKYEKIDLLNMLTDFCGGFRKDNGWMINDALSIWLNCEKVCDVHGGYIGNYLYDRHDCMKLWSTFSEFAINNQLKKCNW